MAMDAQVRAARAACDAYGEDRAALTAHVHAAAAAREDAERELAVCRRQVAAMRADWQRKLRDRRKEVRAFVLCMQRLQRIIARCLIATGRASCARCARR